MSITRFFGEERILKVHNHADRRRDSLEAWQQRDVSYDCSFTVRLGDEERRVMHLVPAPAARPKKRRVLSRPGLNSPLVSLQSYQQPQVKEENDGRFKESKVWHL